MDEPTTSMVCENNGPFGLDNSVSLMIQLGGTGLLNVGARLKRHSSRHEANGFNASGIHGPLPNQQTRDCAFISAPNSRASVSISSLVKSGLLPL